MKPSIAIVMPVFNEGHSINTFLDEIVTASQAKDVDVAIHVVNDASTDNTLEAVTHSQRQMAPISLVTNAENLGHGPSTLRALAAGLDSGVDVIVATDGDGHIRAQQLLDLALHAHAHVSVVEGVRTSRRDAWFRRLASLVTRFLVWLRCGVWPTDANTPHRAYPRNLLKQLLPMIGPDTATPNLLISALVRSQAISFVEKPVDQIQRETTHPLGSTWGQRVRFLPSTRFLRFCFTATNQWIRFRTPDTVTPTTAQKVHRVAVGRGSIGRYGIIGVTGVTIDFLVYWALVSLGLIPILATVVGTSSGIANNYLWNSMLNFKTPLSSSRGLRFLTVGLTGLVASAGLLQLFLTLGLGILAAKWASIPVVVAGQFLANKLWTFRPET